MGKARDYIPALKFGHKIYPQDLAGMVGQPVVGNIFYVDPGAGSDTANNGKSFKSAYATLSKAHDSATTLNYDVIIIASSTTAGTTEAAAVTFSKSYITVIGAAAPTNISQRSRIVFTTAATSPQLLISGNGNRFMNVQIATFVDSNVLVELTGERNYFGNVHFAGIGDATAGDDTAARCLYINDGDENVFDGCLLGLDTIMRSAANATVEMAGGVQRNTFFNCMFQMATDAETPVHVKSTGTSGLDRWQRFDNCIFYNFTTNDTAKVNAVFDVSAQTATADILMSGHNVHVGFDDWEATNSSNLWFQGYTNTANVVGIGINPSVS